MARGLLPWLSDLIFGSPPRPLPYCYIDWCRSFREPHCPGALCAMHCSSYHDGHDAPAALDTAKEGGK